MIEDLLKELTAAVRENTEAMREGNAVRAKAVDAATSKLAGVKAKTEPAEEAEEKAVRGRPPRSTSKTEEKAPAKGKADAKAEAKAPAKGKGKAKEDTTIATTVSLAEVRKIGGDYLAVEDEDQRDERKAQIKAALAHLGFAKTAEIDNNADRCRYAEYVKRWLRGEEFDFEDVDAEVEAALEADGGDEEDDEEV